MGQLIPDKRHVHTDTAMRLPDEFVSNGKTKLDLENDCCMVEVNNIGLSDFQKLKKAKKEEMDDWQPLYLSCFVSYFVSLLCLQCSATITNTPTHGPGGRSFLSEQSQSENC